MTTIPTITVVSPILPDESSEIEISLNNPLDQAIEFSINSDSIQDFSTLNVTIDGYFAVLNGVLKPGYTLDFESSYSAQDGYVYNVIVTRTTLFEYLQSVNVILALADHYTKAFSFITLDNLPPQILNIAPAPLSTQATATQAISFDLRTGPFELPIDLNTLTVSTIISDGYGNPVETALIEPDAEDKISYDQRQVAITPSADRLGYSITLQPLTGLPLSSRIILQLSVQKIHRPTDTIYVAPELNYEWLFSTIDDRAPLVKNQSPAPDSSNHSINTSISFTIADKNNSFFGTGINLDTLQVVIDDEIERSNAIINGTIQVGNGYTGSVITPNLPENGYNIFLVREAIFLPRKNISVEVTVSDNSNNTQRTKYAFSTESVVPPSIVFVYPQPNTVNISQNPELVIDFISDISVSELDLQTITVTVNGVIAFTDNTFNNNFQGKLFGSSSKVVSLLLQSNALFSLNSNIQVQASISNIFGDSKQATNNFTITSSTTLTSAATPKGGIYDVSHTNDYFSDVGTWVSVTLTSNVPTAIIGYTLDGYEPSFDSTGIPQGSTQIYTTPIILLTSQQAMLAHRAYDPSLNLNSVATMEVYIFTRCPEVDIFKESALVTGLEYTKAPKLINVNFQNNSLETGSSSFRGVARYTHDLGRLSYIDCINFSTTGSASFKVRVANTLAALSQASWLNSNTHLSDGVDPNQLTLVNGLGTSIEVVNGRTRVSGRKGNVGLFNDEGYATLNNSLPDSFLVEGEVLSNVDIDAIVGYSAFFRIADASSKLEIQQYLSKAKIDVNTTTTESLSSLVGETPQIFINDLQIISLDGYNTLTDGYDAYVVLIPPPETVNETLQFTFTKLQSISTNLELEEDTTSIFTIKSQSLAVYDGFKYSNQSEGYAHPSFSIDSEVLTSMDHIQSVRYSPAKVKEVFYNKIETKTDSVFAIPVTNLPLDIALAEVSSENLIPGTNKYQFAETNNVFTSSIFLEAGDYNFRYEVTSPTGTRVVGNPFLFQTTQDLSSLVGDGYVYTLHSNNAIYSIESIVKLQTGEYAFEFTSAFPHSTTDIVSWELRNRAGSIIQSSTRKITVDNPLNATITTDASGALGNIVVNTRKSLTFNYVSSTATKISLLGTFNNFNSQINILQEGLDILPISRLFDGSETTRYINDTQSIHKITIKPLLPMIVDRVRLSTDATLNQKQRARLTLDNQPTTNSTYRAYRGPYLATYAPNNAVDVYTYSDGYYNWTEWRYFPIGNSINSAFREKLELTTRFDNFTNTTRSFRQLDIYTRSDIPQVVSDFIIPNNKTTLTRTNKTAFAAESNIVTVKYGRLQNLQYIPTQIKYIRDQGIINNFLRAEIVAPGLISTDGYISATNIFDTNDKVLVSDGYGNSTYTSILQLDKKTGFTRFADPVSDKTFLVKDYLISEEENNFAIKLEVPEFTTIFYGTIHSFGTSLETATTLFEDLGFSSEQSLTNATKALRSGHTVLALNNTLGVSGEALLGGRFTYPIIEKPSRITSCSSIEVILNGSVIPFIIATIDQAIEYTHPELGATIEVFNTTKIVTDYLISKVDGTAKLLNNSTLSNGVGVQIEYDQIPIVFQAPLQTKTFSTNPSDEVAIYIQSSLVSATIAELEAFTVDFFNGVQAQAPTLVTFEIQAEAFSYTRTIPLSEADIVDGYSQHLYNPLYPTTGQVVQFKLPVTDIPLGQIIDGYGYLDGYGSLKFSSIKITFTGQSTYEIGEVQAIVRSSIINSACRIVFNNTELYRSSKAIGKSTNIQIGYDQNMIFINHDGETVLRRPLILQNAHLTFGATGKVFDDAIQVDFSNVGIFEYFSTSPAKIQTTGRFMEIEGVLIS